MATGGEYMFFDDRDVNDRRLHDPIALEQGGYIDHEDDPADDPGNGRVPVEHPDVTAARFDDYGRTAEQVMFHHPAHNNR